jgi:hypothetical protein
MIRAEGSNILFRIRATFAKWHDVMRLEKHAAVRCSESGPLAVLTKSLRSTQSSSAKCCITNEFHSRNHAALDRRFGLRRQRELVDKPSWQLTPYQFAFPSFPIIGSDCPRHRVQDTAVDARGIRAQVVGGAHLTVVDYDPNRQRILRGILNGEVEVFCSCPPYPLSALSVFL